MPFTARCWMRPPAALAAATILLTACEGASSDTPRRTCPPVVEYSRVEQARVAEEVAVLPLLPYLDTLRWLFIALALGGIAVAVWARVDDWKKGLR